MGKWFAYNIPNVENRTAYLETIETCSKLCQSSIDLQRAIDALYSLQNDLKQYEGKLFSSQKIYGLFPGPISSGRRETLKYKISAVEQSIQIAEGIKTRYLVAA